MTLYLVQHGKSLPKEEDPDQGLSETGKAETRRMAQLAADHQLNVERIHHSVKTRARQTAEIFAEVLSPEKGILEIEGIKPMDDVSAFARHLNPEDNLMVVGHMPFMSRLTALLTTGRMDPPMFRFQNSGIVGLDKSAHEKTWEIVWSLLPDTP